MALKWIESFDDVSTAVQLAVAGGYPASNTTGTSIVTGRNGNAFRSNGGSGELIADVGGTSATGVLGFAFRVASLPNATYDLVRLSEGSTLHTVMRMNASQQFTYHRGGTLVATGSTVIAFNTWYHVEIESVIADSGGTINCKINEISDVTFTGDTKNGGTGYIDRFSFRGWANTDYDDVFFFDNAGFRGDCKVETLRPTGAGNSTGWTPSTGSNYQNVDDTTPDDDSTYNSAATAGDKDTFALGNLATTSGSVLGLVQVVRFRKDDAGSRSIATVVRTGATDYDGSTASSSTTYGYTRTLRETNPNTTSAWTISEVNGMEAGYKVVA